MKNETSEYEAKVSPANLIETALAQGLKIGKELSGVGREGDRRGVASPLCLLPFFDAPKKHRELSTLSLIPLPKT